MRSRTLWTGHHTSFAYDTKMGKGHVKSQQQCPKNVQETLGSGQTPGTTKGNQLLAIHTCYLV